MALESSISGNILEYLNGLPYTTAEKIKGSSCNSGKPDINGCCRGQSFRIETKTPDNRNKTSKKQDMNLKRWEKAGAIVLVAYSLEFVKRVFGYEGVLLSPSDATYLYSEGNGCSSTAVFPRVKRRK